MQFQSPANVISLNMEFMFSLKDDSEFQIQESSDKKESKEKEAVKEERDLEVAKLGQFSLKVQNIASNLEENYRSGKGKKLEDSLETAYLPLIIHDHKGAQFNNNFSPSNLLDDETTNPFASNYPKPHVFFRSAHNHIL